MIRLMLVDDHAVVREGYRRLLERRADLRIEAEAGTAAEALQIFRENPPDVTILDLSLPDMGGIELTRRLLQRAPGARILVFTMHRDALFATQAFRAGVLGYVTKSNPPEELIQAVYKVARGEQTISPDLAPEMALSLIRGESNPLEELSPREFEVLRLLLSGAGVDEIAATLHLSPKTVQNFHYQIKSKLGVKTDIELARLAIKHNLIQAGG